MSDLDQRFEHSVSQSRELPQRPSNEELLKLYGLFKQATEGDVHGERPGGFDFKGAAKFDAWTELKGMSSEDAKNQYIELVEELQEKYSS